MRDGKAARKILTVSTASPYKFASDVFASLGKSAKDELSALDELQSLTGVSIPTPLSSLTKREVRFSSVIEKGEMEKVTLEFAGN